MTRPEKITKGSCIAAAIPVMAQTLNHTIFHTKIASRIKEVLRGAVMDEGRIVMMYFHTLFFGFGNPPPTLSTRRGFISLTVYQFRNNKTTGLGGFY
jgi:hypothetical protein